MTMTKKDDGGAAFPCSATDEEGHMTHYAPGMSYRQWLIGKIINGMISNNMPANIASNIIKDAAADRDGAPMSGDEIKDKTNDQMARLACDIADTVIERERETR